MPKSKKRKKNKVAYNKKLKSRKCLMCNGLTKHVDHGTTATETIAHGKLWECCRCGEWYVVAVEKKN